MKFYLQPQIEFAGPSAVDEVYRNPLRNVSYINNLLRKALISACTIVLIHLLVFDLAGLRPSNPPHQQGETVQWTISRSR